MLVSAKPYVTQIPCGNQGRMNISIYTLFSINTIVHHLDYTQRKLVMVSIKMLARVKLSD